MERSRVAGDPEWHEPDRDSSAPRDAHARRRPPDRLRPDRSVAWYQTSLGLRVHAHEGTIASLGDGEVTVLVLHEDPLARPAGRSAGLYHYALLYPSREELARAAVRLSVTSTPIDGASDHRTHEAIYLSDPDGNGIELAADRPRAQWPVDLGYASGPAALDFDALWATIAGEPPAPHVGPGLRIGHLHLHVGDIDEACASTATCSASRSRPTSARPPSCPPATTTITWASTSGAARASRAARPHRRPGPLDRAAAGRGARRGARPRRGRRGHRRRLPRPRPVGDRRGVRRLAITATWIFN